MRLLMLGNDDDNIALQEQLALKSRQSRTIHAHCLCSLSSVRSIYQSIYTATGHLT
jgi:hypothetical protein